MHLSLEAIQTLDAIDRHGSFAAAAVAMNKVPSAITYTVRKLEEELDLLLYDRRGHRAKLTDAGLELLTQGRLLLKAAQELEQRVKRAATGWEVELKIVLDGIIPFERFLPLIKEFESQNCGTRLRISEEVLSGVWESLIQGRADLAIGAAYDGPDVIRMQGAYQSKVLGEIDWVFAVAPTHPLALVKDSLDHIMIQHHRVIAVGDTGRNLPSITSGILSGQDTLTVPSITAKIQAQLAGLGCGHLPRSMVQHHLDDGSLIEKQLLEFRPNSVTRFAWRNQHKGKAIKWFLQKLGNADVQKQLLGSR
jgi:DNA-binding transcriptional LysR family regulator